ncbi:hypothetical protein RQP46_009238 [Phenoliferia psychrophenolica]
MDPDAAAAERKEKAARAKEKLRKFQAKKKDASSSPGSPRSVVSPPPPSDRTTPLPFPAPSPTPRAFHIPIPIPLPLPAPATPTPAPVQIEPHHQAPSPSPSVPASPIHSSSTGVVVSPPIPSSPTNSSDLVHTQQQTISLLVADKSSLANRVRELELQLEGTEGKDGQLTALASKAAKGEADLHAAQEANARLADEVRTWTDRLKTMERESELTKHTLSEVRNQLVSRDRSLRDVSRQLQDLQSSTALSDLEAKLRQKSAHADGLELELSKARAAVRAAEETSIALKADSDAFEFQLDEATSEASIAKANLAKLVDLTRQSAADAANVAQELEDLRLEKETVDAALAEARQRLSLAMQDGTSTHESHESALSRIASLEDSLALSDRKAEAAAVRRDGLQQENTDLMASLEELRGKVVSLSNEQAELSDRNASLQRTIREKDAEKEQAGEVEKELATLREEHTEVLSATEALEEEIAARGATIDELRDELESTRSALREQQTLAGTLEDALAVARKDSGNALAVRDDLQKEVESALSRIASLESQLVAAQASEASHSTRAESLAATIAELESTHSASSSHTAKLSADLAALTLQHDELSKNHSSALARAENAEASHSELQDKFSQISQEHDRTSRAHNETREILETVSEDLDHHRRLLEESSTAALASESLLASTQSELATLQASHSEVEATLGSVQAQLATTTASLASLEAQVTDLTATSLSHSQRADSLAQSLSESSAQVALLTESLTAAEASLSDSELARQHLESDLDASKVAIEPLEREVEETRVALAAAESRAASFKASLEILEKEKDAVLAKLVESEEEAENNAEYARELSKSLDARAAQSDVQAQSLLDLERRMEEELDAHATAASVASSELSLARTQLADTTSLLSASSVTRATLESTIMTLESRVLSLEASLTAAQTESSSTAASLLVSESSLVALKTSNAELLSQNATLTSSLTELRETLATLTDSHSTSAERAQALADSLQEREEAAAAAAAAAEALRLELISLREQIALAESRAKLAEDGRDQAKTAEDNVREKLRTSEQDLEQTRDDLDALDLALKESGEELDALAETRNELDRANLALQASLEAAKSANEPLRTEKQTIEEHVQALQRTIREKDAALADVEAGIAKEVETANSLVQERNTALSAAVRRASKSERELKAIMASGTERAEDQDELRADHAKFQDEIARLRAAGDAHALAMARLTKELEANVHEVQSLRVEVDERQTEAEEATRAVEDLKESYLRAQEDLDAKDAEIEELRVRPSPMPGSPDVSKSGATPNPSTHPYDRDYIDAIQQQHELDLSTARAQIRKLEERIFVAEDSGYKMKKTNGDLKSQVESMLETLEMERDRTRRKERELAALRDAGNSGQQMPPPAVSPSVKDVAVMDPLASATSSPPRLPTVASPPRPTIPPPPRAKAIPPVSPPPNVVSTPPVTTVTPPVAVQSPPVASAVPTIEPAAVAPSPLPTPPPPEHDHSAHDHSSHGHDHVHEEVGSVVTPPSEALVDPYAPRDELSSSEHVTRHARKESLSILKTRMEDELGVDDLVHTSERSPMSEGGRSMTPGAEKRSRSAVLGDDLVWCAQCTGDLFVV